MESLRYSSPKQSSEQGEDPQHRFEVMVEGEKVGAAEIDYYSKPLPLYQVAELYIDPKHQGKGYASKILAQVEDWLIQKGKPGVLVDAIMEGEPAEGMYARRGWTEVPNGNGLHVFNWPSEVGLAVLDGYPMRYTDILERESFKK